MKTIFISALSVLILLTVAMDAHAQDEIERAKNKTALPFMHAKLVGSQNVLEGLVTEDFKRIYRSAENMKRMSEAAQWPRAEDKVYDHYGEQFRRQCDKLMKLSDEKNLEGAHYTYLGMTTTCINCHNYVRGKFRIQRDKDDPKGPVRLIPTEWEGDTFQKNRPASATTQ